ncbi:hypothetical protein OE699_14730 [Sedimentimonas flavescens]|uniref:Outer membrane protein beta-barrel domain-containing protein n=1 Tax=Sedimentimonas flavescens TaxID=2851012 RepID=A0ABT3A269_9RHOB|nr:hypothetical protein [Sedimentimonas flavescens]MCV2880103.1 hypothetical protein [Sedimentimonas flavescens]
MKATLTKAALVLAVIAGVTVEPGRAMAQDAISPTSFPSFGVASVTYGPYLRIEGGYASRSLHDAYWLPPGYPGKDPRVNFDLDDDKGAIWGVAAGYDWLNGFRADVELLGRSGMDLNGVWASPGPGPHADITGGTVRTTALMANLYYAPLEQRGSHSRFQPFLFSGLGLANNKVSTWTRTNPDAEGGEERTDRSFEGDSNLTIAAAIGFGASIQLTKPGQHPVILEAAYKYYYFGTAHGGATPLPGSGTSEPYKPLTFKPNDQVVTLSLRIPLKRY